MRLLFNKIVLFLTVIIITHASVYARSVLRLGNVNAAKDSPAITIPLYMTNDHEIAGIEFSITDDTAAVKIDSVLPAGRAAGFTAMHRNNKIVLFNLTGIPVGPGDGKIADILMILEKGKISNTDTVRFTSQTILADRDGAGIKDIQTVPGVVSYNSISGIYDSDNHLPKVYALEQNYPNPFNNSTMIKFAVVEKGKAVIKLYNILGEETETIFNATVNPGWHSVQFQTHHLASGLYIYKINVNGYTAVRKLVLMK